MLAGCCPTTPPESVKSRGTRGQRDAQILAKQDNPHVFALGLKDACCEEPCCCILSGLGAPFGCTACWARKAVLEKYSTNGLDDYVCCQGYIPKICCCDPSTWCAGSRLGLACEGLCCPVFSLSLARLHMMEAKQNRPDPCDYQIIWCSNILQLVSCVLDVVAIFVEQVPPESRSPLSPPPHPTPLARPPLPLLPSPPLASLSRPRLQASSPTHAPQPCACGATTTRPLSRPLPPGPRPGAHRRLSRRPLHVLRSGLHGRAGAHAHGWHMYGAHTAGSRTRAQAPVVRDQEGACATLLDTHRVCAAPPACALQVHHEIKKDSTEAGVVYIVAQGTPACSHSAVPAAAAGLAPNGSRRPRTPARRPSAPGAALRPLAPPQSRAGASLESTAKKASVPLRLRAQAYLSTWWCSQAKRRPARSPRRTIKCLWPKPRRSSCSVSPPARRPTTRWSAELRAATAAAAAAAGGRGAQPIGRLSVGGRVGVVGWGGCGVGVRWGAAWGFLAAARSRGWRLRTRGGRRRVGGWSASAERRALSTLVGGPAGRWG